MSVTARILATWRDPRGVMRAHLAAGPREDRALAVLFGACLLIFVAQWPGLSRAAHLDPAVPLDARIGGALMGTVFLVPLLAYAVAAASHLAARAMGGRGSWFGARMALFWSLLAVSPLMLLQGLVAGFLGPGLAATLVGVAVLAGFLFLWLSALAEAERGPEHRGTT
ncbi:MAG: YIP1 family protein [Gemmobacter sp.]